MATASAQAQAQGDKSMGEAGGNLANEGMAWEGQEQSQGQAQGQGQGQGQGPEQPQAQGQGQGERQGEASTDEAGEALAALLGRALDGLREQGGFVEALEAWAGRTVARMRGTCGALERRGAAEALLALLQHTESTASEDQELPSGTKPGRGTGTGGNSEDTRGVGSTGRDAADPGAEPLSSSAPASAHSGEKRSRSGTGRAHQVVDGLQGDATVGGSGVSGLVGREPGSAERVEGEGLGPRAQGGEAEAEAAAGEEAGSGAAPGGPEGMQIDGREGGGGAPAPARPDPAHAAGTAGGGAEPGTGRATGASQAAAAPSPAPAGGEGGEGGEGGRRGEGSFGAGPTLDSPGEEIDFGEVWDALGTAAQAVLVRALEGHWEDLFGMLVDRPRGAEAGRGSKGRRGSKGSKGRRGAKGLDGRGKGEGNEGRKGNEAKEVSKGNEGKEGKEEEAEGKAGGVPERQQDKSLKALWQSRVAVLDLLLHVLGTKLERYLSPTYTPPPSFLSSPQEPPPLLPLQPPAEVLLGGSQRIQACLKLLLTWLVEREEQRGTEGEACPHSPGAPATPPPLGPRQTSAQAAAGDTAPVGNTAAAAAVDGAAAAGQTGQEGRPSAGAPGAAGAPEAAGTGEGGGVEAGPAGRGSEGEGEEEEGRSEGGEGWGEEGLCWKAWRTASVERLKSLLALLGGTCCHLLAHLVNMCIVELQGPEQSQVHGWPILGLPRAPGEPFVSVPASLATPVGMQMRGALAGAAATLARSLLLLPAEEGEEGEGGRGEGVEEGGGGEEERERGKRREEREEAQEREWERERGLGAAVRARLGLKVPSEVLARLLTSQFDMPWELPMSLAQYEEVLPKRPTNPRHNNIVKQVRSNPVLFEILDIALVHETHLWSPRTARLAQKDAGVGSMAGHWAEETLRALLADAIAAVHSAGGAPGGRGRAGGARGGAGGQKEEQPSWQFWLCEGAVAAGDPWACQCWGLQCRLPRLLLALRRRGWLHRQLAACAPILQLLPPPDVVDVLHLVWHYLHRPEAPWDAPSPFAETDSVAAAPLGGGQEGGGDEGGAVGDGKSREGGGVAMETEEIEVAEEVPVLMNALGTKLFLILRKHVGDLGPLMVDMCFPM